MATINVKDAGGATVPLEKPLVPGQATMANSRPVVLASDQSAHPVTISGTATVTGTLAATQSGAWVVAQSGVWSVRNQDGSGNALTSATRGAQQALSVQIVDASGAQITTFGGAGGTSSTVGAAFPTLGTAIGVKSSANMVALEVGLAGNPPTTALSIQGISGSATPVRNILHDGTNQAKIQPASTAPVATDPALTVAISPNSQNPNGQTLMASSSPVVIASDQTSVKTVSGGSQYETIASNVSTPQIIGSTGAVGDYFEGLLCIVGTAANSLVQIKDGALAAMDVLPNGVGAGVGTYFIPIGLRSVNGAWQVTTASGVKAIATGSFT